MYVLNKFSAKLCAAVFAGIVQTAAIPAAVCIGAAGNEAASGAAGAQPPAAELPFPDTSSADTIWLLLKVILFLIFIIGLFFFIMKIISRNNRYLLGRTIRSLGGVPLGTNKSIQVVEIGGTLYIVGVGENVQLIDKIDDADKASQLAVMLTASPAVPSGLGEWLNKLRKRPADGEEIELPPSFQQVFHSKLQQVASRKQRVEELLNDEQLTDRLNDKP